MRVTGFESTPNPNAMKCVVVGDHDACAGDMSGATIRSYRTAAEAVHDPLAASLFSVEGVANVLISGGWITVGKQADAEWKSMKPKIKRVIESHADGVVRGT